MTFEVQTAMKISLELLFVKKTNQNVLERLKIFTSK